MRSRILATSAIVVALCMSFTGMARASGFVVPGFDLLRHVASSFDFDTVPNPQVVDFEGVPLGCFDFGAGCVATGSMLDFIGQPMVCSLIPKALSTLTCPSAEAAPWLPMAGKTKGSAPRAFN